MWDHPDLKPLEGQEVVLHSSRGGNGKTGGVAVKHGSYVASKDGANHKAGDTIKTVEISVSKLGMFQLVAVYHQANPSAASAAPTTSQDTTKPSDSVKREERAPAVDPRAEGQRAGMVFKLAGDYQIARLHPDSTEDDFVEAVKKLAVKLAQASREIGA